MEGYWGMNPLTQITLGEFQSFLYGLKDEVVLCPGYGTPHAYKGGCTTIAFEPKSTTTVRELRNDVERALTESFPNPCCAPRDYCRDTVVFVAAQDHYGQPLTFGTLIIAIEPWFHLGDGFNRAY
jgi:hypothetical protein